MGIYDDTNFDYLIKISPNKTEGLFITNIDKNSDRKKITLDVSYKISKRYLKTSLMCDIFVQNYTRSSSYIIASGEFNASNIAADDEIYENYYCTKLFSFLERYIKLISIIRIFLIIIL